MTRLALERDAHPYKPGKPKPSKDSMRGAQVKPEDVKGVATAKLRVRVPQCLSWPAIARWNRDGRTRPVGAMRAHL